MRLRRGYYLIASAALALIGAAILYGGLSQFGAERSEPSAPVSAGAGAASFAFSFLDRPRAVPTLGFTDGEGRALSLAGFRGRPVLLNIWATWCVPCREEMPSLDRLQAQLGPSRLKVLPLSIDRQGLPVVEKFYRDLGLKALGIYLDRDGNAGNALGAVGVPTTLLIDREGREVGRKIGAAAWDSPTVVALLRDHLGIAESKAP
jgi:thiol-disulfide isomerase/thioredoxin